MKLETVKKEFVSKLAITYPNEEINSLFKILCLEYLDLCPSQLLLSKDDLISRVQLDWFSEVIVRLLNEEPIQYILSKTSFYGLDIKCNPSALIPRPETEELVDWILKSEKNRISILDIGTGSGCVSVSLAKNNKDYSVSALDVSKSALDLAEYNALSNKVNINFINADILEYNSDIKYDLIVSNPPYVRNLEKKKMQNNVLNFEPELALFVEDNDPLVFYRAILEFANFNLIEKGKIYFEINEYLFNGIKELLISFGYNKIELREDAFGKLRFARAVK
jgi:release factor glutamine methyltransferase